MGQFTTPVNDTSFEREVLGSDVPVLVDFWAEWCPPCKALAPKLEEVAEEMGTQVRVMKLDVDSSPEVAAKYSVRSIPTLILFKGGQPVDQVMGNLPKDRLLEFIKEHV